MEQDVTLLGSYKMELSICPSFVPCSMLIIQLVNSCCFVCMCLTDMPLFLHSHSGQVVCGNHHHHPPTLSRIFIIQVQAFPVVVLIQGIALRPQVPSLPSFHSLTMAASLSTNHPLGAHSHLYLIYVTNQDNTGGGGKLTEETAPLLSSTSTQTTQNKIITDNATTTGREGELSSSSVRQVCQWRGRRRTVMNQVSYCTFSASISSLERR